MQGYVHSIETMGTVDGPGLRYVVFLSGCPLRCKYCHNPDSWKKENGTPMSATELLEDFEKYRAYLRNGGLTVSGGEPLVQIDFVIELFELAKQRGIHTCLDSSGASFSREASRLEKFQRLMSSTDLVMLDLKHIDPLIYKKLCGGDPEEPLSFLSFLSEETACEIWIRHVILEGYTYKIEYLYRLGYALAGYKRIKALDVLPYHTMGVKKYEELGIDYPLKDAKELSKEQAASARSVIEAGMRDRLLGKEAQY